MWVWGGHIYYSSYTDTKHLSYLDRLIESDLHYCSRSLFGQDNRINAAVRSYKTLTTYTRALKKFVPAKYSPQFRNPCWYSTMTVPKNVLKTLTSISVLKSPVYSDKQAVWLTKNIWNTNSESKKSLYCLPSVYLAGFPKCATTALYRIITAHPSLAQPLHKEGHFWRTFVQNQMKYPHKVVHTLWYLFQFLSASKYIKSHPDALTLDASASTMWASVPSLNTDTTQMHSHYANWCLLSQMISTVTPDAKFIVIMRDPVRRLFSDFWYFCANHNWRNSKGEVVVPQKYKEHAPEIFHNYTVRVIREFATCVKSSASEFECVRRATRGVGSEQACFPLRVGLGMYYFHIVQWLNVSPMKQFLFLRTEDLDRGPLSQCSDGVEVPGAETIEEDCSPSLVEEG